MEPHSSSSSQEYKEFVQSLSSFSISRLEKEPRALRGECDRLKQSLETESVRHYDDLLQSAQCSQAAQKACSAMLGHIGALKDGIPSLAKRCDQFQERAVSIRRRQRLDRLLLENQVELLELLEIPSLMDTCVRNGLFEEALDLEAHVKALCIRYRGPQTQLQLSGRSTRGGSSGANGVGSGASAGVGTNMREQTAASASVSASGSGLASSPSDILDEIGHEMRGTMRKIHAQLLESLRGAIILPQCLRVVAHLRRMQLYDERGLRFAFLSARSTWLDAQLVAVLPAQSLDTPSGNSVGVESKSNIKNQQSAGGAKAGDERVTAGASDDAPARTLVSPPRAMPITATAAYQYLNKVLDLNRVHLFDIITQYRAIFVEEDAPSPSPKPVPSSLRSSSATSPSSPTSSRSSTRSDHRGLLFHWVAQRASAVISTLARYLPYVTEGSLLSSTLEQCMYCGVAVARVGVDFRTLLPPLFEKTVIELFRANLSGCLESVSNALKTHPWRIEERQLIRLGLVAPSASTSAGVLASSADPDRVRPDRLLVYPPLAIALNVVIGALNQLRACAPIAVWRSIASELTLLTDQIGSTLAGTKSSASAADSHGVSVRDDLMKTLRDTFVPIVCELTNDVFHRDDVLRPREVLAACSWCATLADDRKMAPDATVRGRNQTVAASSLTATATATATKADNGSGSPASAVTTGSNLQATSAVPNAAMPLPSGGAVDLDLQRELELDG